MDKKKLIIVGAIVSVVILGTVAFGFVKDFIIKKDPFNHLAYSIAKNDYSAIEGRFDSQIRVKPEVLSSNLMFFTSNPDAMAEFLTAVLDEVRISGKMINVFDLDKDQWYYQQSASINYGEGALLTMEIAANEKGIGMNSPMASSKSVVLTKDALFELIKSETGNDFSQVDYKKYIQTMNLKKDPLFKAFAKDYKGYEAILREKLTMLEKGPATSVTLSDGKTVQCDTILLEMTYAELMDLYNALLNEAKYDLELKALVKGKILENMNLLLTSEDYKLFDMQASDLVSAIEAVEADFDETWELAIQEILDVYAQVEDMQMSYQMVFAIDSKYRMRQVQTTSEVMGVLVEQTMTYEDYHAKAPGIEALNNESAHYALSKMIEDEAYAQEAASELISGGLDHVLNSEAVTYMMNDIKDKAKMLPADEAQTVIELIQYFFDNREIWKNTLMEGLEF